jgi:hypothetical protein
VSNIYRMEACLDVGLAMNPGTWRHRCDDNGVNWFKRLVQQLLFRPRSSVMTPDSAIAKASKGETSFREEQMSLALRHYISKWCQKAIARKLTETYDSVYLFHGAPSQSPSRPRDKQTVESLSLLRERCSPTNWRETGERPRLGDHPSARRDLEKACSTSL